mgnify:CR=1 FL=1
MKNDMDNISYLSTLKKEIDDNSSTKQWVNECYIFLSRLKIDSSVKDSIKKEADRLIDSLDKINA